MCGLVRSNEHRFTYGLDPLEAGRLVHSDMREDERGAGLGLMRSED